MQWIRVRAAVAAAALGASAAAAQAAPIGHWRMDEAGASAGGTVGAVSNAANPGTINGAGQSNARFSADVAGPQVFDPVAGTFVANTYSLDASASNARVVVANNAALDVGGAGDKSFTIEFFIKLVGEPANYENFLSRVGNGAIADTTTTSDRHGWQVDFDHASAASTYGKVRSRWDTPGTPPPDFNRVTTSGGYLLVDTDSGSGAPADYDAADVATDGDGANDLARWRNVAVTYNDANRQYRIYLDGVAGNLQTLAGPYAHPAANLEFGKFGGGYGLLVDEVRLSSGALTPGQFLQAVPEPSTAAAAGLAGVSLLARRRRRRAS